ncbi:MAG TPA: helicase-related protein [Polyangiales bacterium]
MSEHVLLGPTNTGKTHRAIERMLEFERGMIGLPLRLLAREIYDRLTPRVGEQAVALITGEEKRVPARPRYWVCTIEAMPLEQEVEFAAVDEIQLISHPERGHVFTDRLLHLRARAETWFLGSDTAEGIVRAHLPLARVRKLPRLSTLHYAGQASLRTLPRRSAVVAFSLPQVYELADVLRVRRKGAAVVLGALSPRVRNAQVALYQAGEVDFLVATDAIGMGLNLDIDHVALAARSKFDGFETRELLPAELAQIAGRAGRYLKDGSFGVLAPEPELSPGLIEQLEGHRFAPQRFAYYRNSNLDFQSLAALVASLEQKPRGFALRSAPDADDLLVLRVLAARPELAELARDARRVELLWDLCRIPNYEKRIAEHQAQRVLPLYRALLEHGSLPEALIEAEVSRIARFEGDIHSLMERLAAIRTWSYVSQKAAWVDDAGGWRERTREIEDKLGDVLHQKLIERFVSVGAEARRRPTRAPATAVPERSAHPFAKLASLLPSAPEAEAPADLAEQLIAASFDALTLAADGYLLLGATRVARLVAGPTLLHPQLKLLLSDLSAGTRARVERRLLAHLKDLSVDLLGPLSLAGEVSPPLRGLLYQLEQGLGTVARRDATKEWRALSAHERERLEQAEIVVGHDTLFARRMLSGPRLRLRRALTRLVDPEVDGVRAVLEETAALKHAPRLAPASWRRLGFAPLGKWLLRCDVLELMRRARHEHAEDGALSREVALLLGADGDAVRDLVRALGPARRTA